MRFFIRLTRKRGEIQTPTYRINWELGLQMLYALKKLLDTNMDNFMPI